MGPVPENFLKEISGVHPGLDIYLKYPGKRTVGAVAGKAGAALGPLFLFLK